MYLDDRLCLDPMGIGTFHTSYRKSTLCLEMAEAYA